MAFDDLSPEIDESTSEETNANGEEQKKSLVANTYSRRGVGLPTDDRYKELEDWQLSDDEITLAYELNAPQGGSAVVQNFLDAFWAGGHEEFYSELQIAIAHMVAHHPNYTVREFDERDIEAQGAVPVMELFQIDTDDVASYLSENQDIAQEIYEALREADFIQEPAEAE